MFSFLCCVCVLVFVCVRVLVCVGVCVLVCLRSVFVLVCSGLGVLS